MADHSHYTPQSSCKILVNIWQPAGLDLAWTLAVASCRVKPTKKVKKSGREKRAGIEEGSDAQAAGVICRVEFGTNASPTCG